MFESLDHEATFRAFSSSTNVATVVPSVRHLQLGSTVRAFHSYPSHLDYLYVDDG